MTMNKYKIQRTTRFKKSYWLLVYMKDKNTLILLLVDTGSHSDLFK